MQQVSRSKNIFKNGMGKSRNITSLVVHWAEVQDRVLQVWQSHSLFPSLTLNHITLVMYLCLVMTQDEKKPDSCIKTEIIKWRVTKYTANITTISICEYPTLTWKYSQQPKYQVSKQQVILHSKENSHQAFLMLKTEITIIHAEYSPPFWMLSSCKAGQLCLLWHYRMAL